MVDVKELNVFLQAAETRNFSQAARRLGISQPAVSLQIQSLEERIGKPLFHREDRSMRLTEAGDALLPLARDMVNLSTEIDHAMSAINGQQLVGQLRIVCSTTSGKYVLPHLMARFRQHQPGVQATMQARNPQTALKLVQDNAVHLGVISAEPRRRGIESRRFFTNSIVLVAPSDHPWANTKIIEPQALLGVPLILREETSGTRRATLNALAERHIRPDDLNVVMELGSSEAIQMSVAAGIGVSFVPRLAAASFIEAGHIVEVSVQGMKLERSIYLMRNRHIPPTQIQKAFWDFIFQPENQDLLQMAS